jgi:hypothetical protein
MQLRERQYQSRLARSASSRRPTQRHGTSLSSSRPPLQVMKTVMKWLPAVIAAGIVIYLLDRFVF